MRPRDCVPATASKARRRRSPESRRRHHPGTQARQGQQGNNLVIDLVADVADRHQHEHDTPRSSPLKPSMMLRACAMPVTESEFTANEPSQSDTNQSSPGTSVATSPASSTKYASVVEMAAATMRSHGDQLSVRSCANPLMNSGMAQASNGAPSLTARSRQSTRTTRRIRTRKQPWRSVGCEWSPPGCRLPIPPGGDDYTQGPSHVRLAQDGPVADRASSPT